MPLTQTDDAPTIQRYARVAGVAMLLSIVFGGLGEAYLPAKIIVSGDAAASAANILAHPMLFRASFATYFVEGVCDVALCLLWYVILKPVNRHLALMSAFFGIVSMVMYAVAQSSFFAASLVVRDASVAAAFTVEQRNALVMICLRLSVMVAALFLAIYGIATMLRGWLIMRSGYLPKVLGILFMIGGFGFIVRTATYVLAPSLSSAIYLLPMAAAGLPLMVWLLWRGVDVPALASRG